MLTGQTPDKGDEAVLKRILAVLMVAGVLVVAIAPVALAATAAEQSWSAPRFGTGLEYRLAFNRESSELVLYVHNPTRRPVSVEAPTAQLTDFVLWRNGKPVWRASQGNAYAQAATQVTFRRGETKTYTQALPGLPSGTYFVEAYYMGESRKTPVASTYIWLDAVTREPLQYSVEYMGPSWFNSTPRLRVTVKNTSGRDITLPYQYMYQILIKRVGAPDYLPNVGMGQSVGTIEKDATRYIFVNLNDLRPGAYQVDIRSNVSHQGWYSVVASSRFFIQ